MWHGGRCVTASIDSNGPPGIADIALPALDELDEALVSPKGPSLVIHTMRIRLGQYHTAGMGEGRTNVSLRRRTFPMAPKRLRTARRDLLSPRLLAFLPSPSCGGGLLGVSTQPNERPWILGRLSRSRPEGRARGDRWRDPVLHLGPTSGDKRVVDTIGSCRRTNDKSVHIRSVFFDSAGEGRRGGGFVSGDALWR